MGRTDGDADGRKIVKWMDRETGQVDGRADGQVDGRTDAVMELKCMVDMSDYQTVRSRGQSGWWTVPPEGQVGRRIRATGVRPDYGIRQINWTCRTGGRLDSYASASVSLVNESG